jgi:hypothetical protein
LLALGACSEGYSGKGDTEATVGKNPDGESFRVTIAHRSTP